MTYHTLPLENSKETRGNAIPRLSPFLFSEKFLTSCLLTFLSARNVQLWFSDPSIKSTHEEEPGQMTYLSTVFHRER